MFFLIVVFFFFSLLPFCIRWILAYGSAGRRGDKTKTKHWSLHSAKHPNSSVVFHQWSAFSQITQNKLLTSLTFRHFAKALMGSWAESVQFEGVKHPLKKTLVLFSMRYYCWHPNTSGPSAETNCGRRDWSADCCVFTPNAVRPLVKSLVFRPAECGSRGSHVSCNHAEWMCHFEARRFSLRFVYRVPERLRVQNPAPYLGFNWWIQKGGGGSVAH